MTKQAISKVTRMILILSITGMAAIPMVLFTPSSAQAHCVFAEHPTPVLGEFIAHCFNPLLDRVPEKRPNVQGLADQFDLELLMQLDMLIKNMRQQIGGFNAIIEELAAGLNDFAPTGDCSAMTPCSNFKSQLNKLFDDFEQLWESTQKLGCIDNPELVIREIPTELIRSLVDKTPIPTLFTMKKFLDLSPDWPNVIGNLNAAIPPVLTEFCTPALGSTSQISLTPQITATPQTRVCSVLDDVHRQMLVLKFQLELALFGFDLTESWSSDDKEVTGAVTVVGGGGAGTNIKNPANASLKSVKVLLERIKSVIEKLIARRDACIEQDLEFERDLESCTELVGNFLPREFGGHLEQGFDIINLRIEKLEAASIPTAKARGLRNQAEELRLSGAYRDAFETLCSAHDALGK